MTLLPACWYFPRGTDFDPMQLTRTYCGSLRGAFESEDEATRSSSQIQSCTHASHWLFRLILMCAAKSQECRGLGTTAPDPQIFPTLRALRCDVSTGWVEMWKCCEKWGVTRKRRQRGKKSKATNTQSSMEKKRKNKQTNRAECGHPQHDSRHNNGHSSVEEQNENVVPTKSSHGVISA